jgi:hypothetical protein
MVFTWRKINEDVLKHGIVTSKTEVVSTGVQVTVPSSHVRVMSDSCLLRTKSGVYQKTLVQSTMEDASIIVLYWARTKQNVHVCWDIISTRTTKPVKSEICVWRRMEVVNSSVI